MTNIQSGRSMVEMLGVLAIIGLLSITGLYGFKQATTSAQVNTTIKDLSNAITERRYQNAQGGDTKEHPLNMRIGSTPMEIKNILSGDDKGTFSVTLKNQTKATCEGILEYSMFKPKKVMVNGVEVPENGKISCQNSSDNEVQFFFDQTDTGLTASGDGLSSPCDGIRCKSCEKCDAGKCVVDKNKVGKTFGCGVCQSDGSLKKDESLDYSCSTCDEDDWSIVFKSKGTKCGECMACNGDGKCESTGTKCKDTCCAKDETCDETLGVCQKCEGTGNACQKCEGKKWVADASKDGTTIGECAKCENGKIVADTTKIVEPCQTCQLPDGTILKETDGSHPDGKGKCCKDGSMQEDLTLCTQCPTDQQFDTNEVKCVCRTDLTEPKEAEECTENKCCASGLTCTEGYCCPEGYAAEKTFTGTMKCYPICEKGQKPIGIVFLFDDSSSLKNKFLGTTIMEQIKLSVNNTEIPDGIQYAIYRTDDDSPMAAYNDYGGKSKARSIANSLTGKTYGSRFNAALKHIANNLCSKQQRLLLIMYTDGVIDLNPSTANLQGLCDEYGTLSQKGYDCYGVPWYEPNDATKDIKQKCQTDTALFVTTKSKFSTDLPGVQVYLNETQKLNNLITQYLDHWYCIQK